MSELTKTSNKNTIRLWMNYIWSPWFVIQPRVLIYINLNLEPMSKTIILAIVLVLFVNAEVIPFDNNAV